MRHTAAITAHLSALSVKHSAVLEALVGKREECPRLIWLYPKKRSLRAWLSDPAGMLLSDTLMMMVVCPQTLKVVPCGPDGLGWEIKKPKEWLKKWGPALLITLQILQIALALGRFLALPFPIPSVPSKASLGLDSTTSRFGPCSNALAKASLEALWGVVSDVGVEEGLEWGQEALDTGLQEDIEAVSANSKPMRLTDEAYVSIHTFLTTGDPIGRRDGEVGLLLA